MKVILLQDVAKIGRRGEIAEVPNGYAQNKLIPKGMAKPATPANLKQTQALQAQAAASQANTETEFQALSKQLADVTVTVSVDANENGHLFQAVKAEEVVAAAAEQGITIPQSSIVFTQPIKSIGLHSVTLKHGASLQTTVQLEVVAK